MMTAQAGAAPGAGAGAAAGSGGEGDAAAAGTGAERGDASGVQVLTMQGEMTIYQAEALHAMLVEAIGNCAGVGIELDLAAVTDIDCAGMQLLVAAKKFAESRRLVLRLVRHSPAVQEAFAMLDVSAFFGDPLVLPARQSEPTSRNASEASGAAR